MGRMFVDGSLMIEKGEIVKRFNRIIERDFASRRTEHDMYRGDFGSSRVSPSPLKIYKGKSENVIEKNSKKFIEEYYERFDKYIIDYAITGQLGYIAKSAKLIMLTQGSIRGGLRIKTDFMSYKEFKNITELKKALKENLQFAKENMGETVYDKNWNKVGHIGSDSRVFKTRPKELPKKYQWLDEYVHVTYASWNPI